jgi:MoaA/NifB/PqqE/SkfB family radical SAM enzyme
MDFPRHISFTITNACNLKCAMCGQWSPEGYMRTKSKRGDSLPMAVWKRLADELADHSAGAVLLRGGEPFLFAGILELLEYIAARGIFISIDTNGTQIGRFAADLARFEKLHLTISVDGPEPIHDKVRGVPGCFAQIREGLERLRECEQQSGRRLSKSLNFTITPESVAGLGQMPAVARSLSVDTICIVPYYYVPERLGREYDRILKTQFGCPGYSWRGFHHEESGIDMNLFKEQHRKYLADLGNLRDFPYMPFSADQYRVWFSDPVETVAAPQCLNVESLLDVQPDGQANFCIDFPDYSFGNVKDSSIEALWNSPAAHRFREYRRQQPLPVCHRCGAKYMALITS